MFSEFELPNYLRTQNFQCVALVLAKFSRCIIQNAERTKSMTIDCDQRSTCVKADMRFRGYKRVICETFVCRRVWHHDKFASENCVRAKRGISGGLMNV